MMELKQAMIKVDNLCSDIEKKLREFEQETGLRVDAITVDRGAGGRLAVNVYVMVEGAKTDNGG